MIKIVIILLAIALVALLVDWRKIMARLPKKPAMRMPKMPAAMSARSVARKVATKQPSNPTFDEFPMESPLDTVEEAPTGNPELDKLLADADIHFRKGEMKAAEQLYLQVASKDPKCSKAYSRLGVIYLEDGEDWEDAEAAFRQALKTDAHNGYVLNNLGLVLYHQDKFADAIRNFEQAVHLS
jgi:tetratricopeptide (TPR) repeat protein